MKFPIGYDNFSKVIENQFEFVDKTLLIKDIIDDSAEVILITRPRRFGKTFNLSMLQHFFAPSVHGKSTEGLFDQLKITKVSGSYMEYQGKHPVISLSFKDVKENNFEGAYDGITNLVRELYAEFRELLSSDLLYADEKKIFESILEQNAPRERVQSALKDLTNYISRYYNAKPIVLIDEYDTPIQAGFTHGYYDEITGFLRNFFSAALKSNPYLNKAVLTGILRVSKESLFSGLNNLKAYSLFGSRYGEHFGFTEEEVQQLLEITGFDKLSHEIRDWYNGYNIGDSIIYNPWSIVNCITEKGQLKPYWVNTSDNVLIKKMLINANSTFKTQFERLLNGEMIESIVDENMVFGDLARSGSVIWSLLLLTGYLKVVSYKKTDQGLLCTLGIPNKEIRNLYRTIIEQWLSDGYGIEWYNQFLHSLLTGDIEKFSRHLENIILQTISVHDMAKEPEAFYHGFMLGLSASLDRQAYEVKSNRESGYGRYDIAIIPKDIKKLAIILELKQVEKFKSKQDSDTLQEQLKIASQKALNQIEQQRYVSELEQRGFKNILKIGLAFCGKQFSLDYKKEIVTE